MEKIKENAFIEFVDMIAKSWTYNRLTADERNHVIDSLYDAKLSGTYNQRFEQLHNIYQACLYMLNYKEQNRNNNWREPVNNDRPLF